MSTVFKLNKMLNSQKKYDERDATFRDTIVSSYEDALFQHVTWKYTYCMVFVNVQSIFDVSGK